MKLIENLHCYIWEGRGNNCHSYLFADVLRGERPHILIDPGHIANEMKEQCWEQLLRSLHKDGFSPENVGLVINTHSHIDHCEANQMVVEKSGAKAGKSKARQALIALHQEEDAYRQTIGQKLGELWGRRAEFEPNFYLQEGELRLGKEDKLILNVLHTPGHSPGSLCLYWAKGKVLITGDLLFSGSTGRTDLPGGNGLLLKQSIEKISQLEVEYLLPGHSTEYGSILQGKEKVSQNFAFIKMNFFPLLSAVSQPLPH